MGIRVIQRVTKPPLPSTTMYSVPLSQDPSINSRTQESKRVALEENEIIEDDGWSRLTRLYNTLLYINIYLLLNFKL